MISELYFKDNFFSAGTTDIMNEDGQLRGTLDLKSAFSSSLDVLDLSGIPICFGKFHWGKWEITDRSGHLLGVLRARLSFFSKRYEYEAQNRGTYEITSQAFSRDYQIRESRSGEVIANFEQVSGWMKARAYRLTNYSEQLDIYELIAVVMGVNAIRKRQESSSSTS